MWTDPYGQKIYADIDVCNLYLADPDRKIRRILTETEIKFDEALELIHTPITLKYADPKCALSDFDSACQDKWLIPDEYKNFDIAKFVMELCTGEEELQRAGKELIMYQERDMFGLLIYLKYLVDTMRKHNVVWGVGRGSSVASFVLFLIGIHRINSIQYDLPIEEFLK